MTREQMLEAAYDELVAAIAKAVIEASHQREQKMLEVMKGMGEALKGIPPPTWVCWDAETDNNCSCNYHKAQKALSLYDTFISNQSK